MPPSGLLSGTLHGVPSSKRGGTPRDIDRTKLCIGDGLTGRNAKGGTIGGAGTGLGLARTAQWSRARVAFLPG